MAKAKYLVKKHTKVYSPEKLLWLTKVWKSDFLVQIALSYTCVLCSVLCVAYCVEVETNLIIVNSGLVGFLCFVGREKLRNIEATEEARQTKLAQSKTK